VNRAEAVRDAPHQYIQLPEPVTARHVWLVNKGPVPRGGLFAVRDLRVFGDASGPRPGRASDVKVRRHADDDRNVTVTWKAVPDVDG